MRWAALPPIVVGTAASKLKVDALLRSACLLKLGLHADFRFESALKRYFGTCLPSVWTELGIEINQQRLLQQATPYKTPLVDVLMTPGRSASGWWSRRLAVLRGLGIRLDLMTLASESVIEPHGHSKVVSGFLVLEGCVYGQTYDRIECRPGAWRVRRTFDCDMVPGGFLTNSEWSNNIHYLEGRAQRSLLLRVTVSGFPGRSFDRSFGSERVYVDLSSAPSGCEPFWATVRAISGSE